MDRTRGDFVCSTALRGRILEAFHDTQRQVTGSAERSAEPVTLPVDRVFVPVLFIQDRACQRSEPVRRHCFFVQPTSIETDSF